VPLATALCKTFLLRMFNESRAGRNPTRVVVPIEEEEEESVLDSLNMHLIRYYTLSQTGYLKCPW
jgi:hypothetical protein